MSQPNIVFVFGDQWRAESTGYSGNPDVLTPHLDALAAEGVVFTNAVANCPVCTPYRASLLTGRYPLSTGMFLNDLRLPENEISIGKVLGAEGYETAYIGKWHLDGNQRSGFTPPGPRRQGFDFWAVGNCTHDYMHSLYYRDTPEPRYWPGYDAHAQTDLALDYIREHGHRGQRPYCLFLSWGPPHNPFDVPAEYRARYDPATLHLRPNVTAPDRESLAGYYAHISALDEDLGRIAQAIAESPTGDETLLVFTSDHGDMLGSQGVQRKQWPWDESVWVPLVMRYPARQGAPRKVSAPYNVVDFMPTLLGLANVPTPPGVQGCDLGHLLVGGEGPEPASALIEIVSPFCESTDPEWRGVRTARYTYVEKLDGPWLLYDNVADPYQLHNRVTDPDYAAIRADLVSELSAWLLRTGDEFLPAATYRERWGYLVDERFAIPYSD
jgi:arylsulfatase A-like enzyme